MAAAATGASRAHRKGAAGAAEEELMSAFDPLQTLANELRFALHGADLDSIATRLAVGH